MDISLSEDQKLIKSSAAEFLEKECPSDLVREMEEDEKGFPEDLWRKMAELGWMGLPFPEEYGGMEGGFLDLVILLEEMGKVLVPGPFIPTVVSCGLPILYYGNEAQKKDMLSKISSGELVMSFAYMEPNKERIEMKAEKEDKGYSLNGIKVFVQDAHVSNRILCATNTDEGVTIFIVDTALEGVKITPLKTLSGDKQCEVVFENVKVPDESILGEKGRGLEIVEKMKEWTALATCAFMNGAARAVLDMAVDYAKKRVQFERYIGSFQAIQHKCADMLIAIDGSTYLSYVAASKLDKKENARMEISMAKAWASEVLRKVWIDGLKIHGGIGISIDHDLNLYYRRSKVWELSFGDSDYHFSIVAEEMGL
ncbi:MAG: acyl-CoA dehydrogenase family protein [Candidatus Syntropharchaeia archaeon]